MWIEKLTFITSSTLVMGIVVRSSVLSESNRCLRRRVSSGFDVNSVM